MSRPKVQGPDRVARLLLDFRDRNQVALSGPDLALTLLDFNHDPDVDALCLRLVENPSMDLSKEPREVRALLSRRLTVLLVASMVELDRFQKLARKMPTDDREATAFLFKGLVAPLRLPALMTGQPFSKSLPRWMN